MFAVSVVLGLLVAAPKRKWLFTFHLKQLLDLVDEGTAQPVDVTYNLATWIEEARQWNKTKLERLHVLFGWMCILIGLQVVFWTIAIF